GGQTLAFRTEAVSEPRAERGPPRLRKAGVHEPDGRFMAVDVRVHRADEGHVIHNAGEVGEEFGHFDPALAVLLKFPRAAEQFFGRAIDETESYLSRVILPATPGQFRFRVEQVDVARTAVHEERDHGAGARREQRNLGLEVKRLWLTGHAGRCGEEVFLSQQPREGDAAEAKRVAREKLAAG